MKAVLLLEDGTEFIGKSIGSKGETFGEIIFNTSMTGYQEILTNPSYNGKIITMTYPLIGNYGFNENDVESDKAPVKGFIVKELCDTPSNWRSTINPEDYLKDNGIVGIKGIDTRALTQHIRDYGSMFAVISTNCFDTDTLVRKLNEKKDEKRDLVNEVSTKEGYNIPNEGKKVAVLDLGIKRGIIHSLSQKKCDLYIFPHTASADDLLSINPDGILVSNGPGNPKDILFVVDTVKNLIGKKLILVICMGHLLLGMALDSKVSKLKFGHHGSNHPVKDYITDRTYITSQNHNYVLENNFSGDVEITQIKVNDNTVEGFKHKHLPLIGMQYHPEARSNTMDASYIFDDFIELMNVKY